MTPNFELTRVQRNRLRAAPDTTIDAPHGATLNIWYFRGHTIVETSGEEQNGDPWTFEGHIDPEAVLQQWNQAQAEE